ncbi:MAG: effector protein [Pigeon pea little leaf phytoplasma]|uniref:Effector protein n=1 Tax=Candidatus Phytoplasma fabacearum TaxID=2982628 RepID=A0ABU8ZTH8_9MOLU|nr:effector protein ['Bituminaria bituminosa' little leaf phytoplasma]MDV3149105.1 effector protein [Pigeon pea little leaf phytoplasma]MDO7983827.1 effector protein ['Bituminaria bituminosa' little leaf phytoplasma]MDO8024143.1 effector protein ['Bituminaria bituminosa' little leaf phytoplasma]MDV3154291.1 effector protein [Pigeon pea little leaf phytoplasma]MDV3158380.1 effector protein [Pigeon pea little leaf phytoplasma]
MAVVTTITKEEFVKETRIVNVTVSNAKILRQHPLFQKYFDFSCKSPCYNADLEEFGMVWKIKNPPKNLLGVFFDQNTREDEDDKYTLEDLKYMANKSPNMYILWKYKEK